MHPVICIYCKQKFDRDKEEFVQVNGRRYAHKNCAEKNYQDKSADEKDYDKLKEYIEKLFGLGYVSAKIAKQIKSYKETYHYTYSGILGTLVYWFEIKKSPLDKANGGIGIVPYIYEEAREYYNKINNAYSNATVSNYKFKETYIEIESPKREIKKPKLFKLEEDNNE